AGAALGDAAAVFRAGQPDLLPYHPQERHIGLRLHVANFAVDVELGHERPLAPTGESRRRPQCFREELRTEDTAWARALPTPFGRLCYARQGEGKMEAFMHRDSR